MNFLKSLLFQKSRRILLLAFVLLATVGAFYQDAPFYLVNKNGTLVIQARYAIDGATLTNPSISLPAALSGTSVTSSGPISGATLAISGTSALSGDATTAGITPNGGNKLNKVLQVTAALDFGAIPANSCGALGGVGLTGAADGDPVFIGVPNSVKSVVPNVSFTAFVSSTNTLTVQACNSAVSAAADPPSANYKIVILQVQ